MEEGRLVPGVDQPWLYSLMSVLRVLLLQQEEGEAWGKVREMMDHWEERSRDGKIRQGCHRMATFLQGRLKQDWVTEEDVQHSYGILMTNAVEIGEGAQAVYPLVSIMSHSCVANLEPVMKPGQTVTFRAKRKIYKGEELTMRYIDFLKPKNVIQATAKKVWLFSCSCPRCMDPTEMGTHYSSLQCHCGGFYTHTRRRIKEKEEREEIHIEVGDNMEDEEEEYDHICSSCSIVINLDSLLKQVSQLSVELSVCGYTETIARTVATLPGCHPTFHLSFQLQRSFLAFFKDSEDPVILREMVTQAGKVLETLSKIDQGCTRLSGEILIMLMTARQRLLSHRRDEMENGEFLAEVKDIAKGRLLATKLSSTYSIVRD